MGRRARYTTPESHDWDARADLAQADATNLPDGPDRDEAFRKIDQLRTAADMRRLLTRPQA